MIDEDAFAGIIGMMNNSTNRSVLMDCCTAICNLSTVEGMEYKAVKENAAYTLCHLVVIAPCTLDLCLKTLLNLSCVTEKYFRLEEVCDSLMNFIQTQQLILEHEIIAMSVMLNLSAVRNNQVQILTVT